MAIAQISTTSNDLNLLHEDLSDGLASATALLREHQVRLRASADRIQAETTALSSAIASLQTACDSISAGGYYGDAHYLPDITLGWNGTEGTYFPEYGLFASVVPEVQPINKMCIRDSVGKEWAPEGASGVRILYKYAGSSVWNSVADVQPAFDTYSDTAIAIPCSAGAALSIAVYFPIDYMVEPINAIAMHISPEFGVTLTDARYQRGQIPNNELLEDSVGYAAASAPYPCLPFLWMFQETSVPYLELTLDTGAVETLYITHIGAYKFSIIEGAVTVQAEMTTDPGGTITANPAHTDCGSVAAARNGDYIEFTLTSSATRPAILRSFTVEDSV